MPARMRALYCTLAALALAAAVAPAAQADSTPTPVPIPIQPNYYFTGKVNGAPTPTSIAIPVIKVACPGPITPNETGHPLAGQTVEADALFPPYSGSVYRFTGSVGRQIDVVFSPIAATVNPPIVLSDFFEPYPIPTTLNLPCGGRGLATFVPVPTSGTARNAVVDVLFENVAA